MVRRIGEFHGVTRLKFADFCLGIEAEWMEFAWWLRQCLVGLRSGRAAWSGSVATEGDCDVDISMDRRIFGSDYES